jgi:hypothetical protein
MFGYIARRPFCCIDSWQEWVAYFLPQNTVVLQIPQNRRTCVSWGSTLETQIQGSDNQCLALEVEVEI